MKSKKLRKNTTYENYTNYPTYPQFKKYAENIVGLAVKFINEGANGEVYYFKLNKITKINNKLLKSGEYVIKIDMWHSEDFPFKKELEILSKYGVIPKIFIINKNYLIMKYIPGKIYKFEKLNWPYLEKLDLYNKIKKQIAIIHMLNLNHGDIKDTNILITNDRKIYLIDPHPTLFDKNRNLKDLNDLNHIGSQLGIQLIDL